MFPASILVGFAIGFFLDKWLKTDPWLKIVFILYGIVAGFTNLFSQTRLLVGLSRSRQRFVGRE
jgi:F0F1-type ATP synthase assembly protein I